MIISVASGKGGTGKTLVATSLALSLKDDNKVMLLDCDVEEPNDHVFIKPVITGSESVHIMVPTVIKDKCIYCGRCAEVCAYNAIAVLGEYVLTFPDLCHGCGACSCLCPETAITETPKEIGVVESGYAEGIDFIQGKLSLGEPMPTPVIREVKQKANHDGTVIIDVSPGTSCPVVESIKGSNFCLLVTEPTPFGLNDLTLAVATVKKLKIPCGIVLNRAGVGDGKTEEYCHKENIPILLTIPSDTEIARLYSGGITLAEGMPQWRQSFLDVFSGIQEIISERNSSLKR
jgi:MinD superfamily P-loop ATPase